MANSTVQQYQVAEKGGKFNLVSVPYPTPEPDEVCVRTKAIGLNPGEWKFRAFGIMVESWPTVFGFDGSGVVEAVGRDVKHVAIGDEVWVHAGTGTRTGSYQEVITATGSHVSKKPATLSLVEAATIPCCFMTAATSIDSGLRLSLTFDSSVHTTSSLNSILVLGGSSVVGGHAIQLLRLLLPQATIMTAASAQHHSRLQKLGANLVLERNATADTFIAATPESQGVDAILDTVAAAASAPEIFQVLRRDGPKLYSQVMTGQQMTPPEGVNATVIFGPTLYRTKSGAHALRTLKELFEQGKYQLPVDAELVGNGYEAIEVGLKKLQDNAVSGKKLVVSL